MAECVAPCGAPHPPAAGDIEALYLECLKRAGPPTGPRDFDPVDEAVAKVLAAKRRTSARAKARRDGGTPLRGGQERMVA